MDRYEKKFKKYVKDHTSYKLIKLPAFSTKNERGCPDFLIMTWDNRVDMVEVKGSLKYNKPVLSQFKKSQLDFYIKIYRPIIALYTKENVWRFYRVMVTLDVIHFHPFESINEALAWRPK